nr:TOBE domain-containing protein [Rhizobium rhizolycopersici]
MGEVNFLQGRVREAANDSARVETPVGTVVLPAANFISGKPAPGDHVTLCIRPEHFCEAASHSAVRLGEAHITSAAFFGTHFRCHLAPMAANELSLVAHMPQASTVTPGERIPLALDPSAVTALAAA